MTCLCGSGKIFDECCDRFISKGELPSLPEELMRSRYTAYTIGNIDYIINTTTKEKQKDLNKKELEDWAKNLQWLSLEILEAKEPLLIETQGKVEFIAKYSYGETVHNHHELSTFKKVNGKWFFDDAKFIDEM